MNTKNIPQIRFKEFEGEWEEKKLGEMGTTYNGLSGKTKEDFGHGKGKFITYMNVFSNSISNIDMTDSIEIDHNQNSVKYGDVFFTVSSETPNEVGMSSVYVNNEENIYLNSFCFGYRPYTKQNYNPYFFAYLLRSNTFRNKIILLAQGISRYNISKKKVMEIGIIKPQKDKEQTRIASLFTAIDKQISCSEAKLDKLRTIKKTLLKKMFASQGEKTPQIRFKGFDGEWEEKKLGEICSVNRGVRVTRKDLNEQGKYPVFQNTDYPMGYFSKCNVEENNPFVIIGGSAGLIGFCKEKFWAADDCAYFGDSKEIEKIFLFSLLLNNALFIKKNIRGSSVPRLDKKVLIEMQVQLPTQDISEQTRIASLFTSLDKQISLQVQKIEKLKAVKKTLLKKMFV